MGHRAGKEVYRALANKIDGLTSRAPYNERLRAILEELYTPEEADFVARMPYGFSSKSTVADVTGSSGDELDRRLDTLCEKGLVLDIVFGDEIFFQPSPMIIGIFEFTMMRTRGQLDSARWAKLFSEYLHADGAFYRENARQVSVMRALPHEQGFADGVYTEVLDYERARNIVKEAKSCAIGICSCRHEKHHLGEKHCDVPLETCISFDKAADYLVRHGMAREASHDEILAQLEQSYERGLVLNADNVQKRVSFICQCCSCCCNALAGISKHGYADTVVTSNYIATPDHEACTACGNCSRDCPVDAIEMTPSPEKKFKKNGKPVVDETFCLGCGVCTRRCKSESLTLTPRAQRVLHPETTFERVLLACLERGTLQNQIFSNPNDLGQGFMRGVLGGFLRLPPVKQALMSDTLRSRFLAAMKRAVERQGRGVMIDA